MSDYLGTLDGAVADQVQTEDLRELPQPRRTHRSARKAGTAFESLIAAYLAAELDDDRIERRAKNGVKDRGDITGVRTIRGGRVVIEAKNYSADRIQVSAWLREVETERANDDAAIGAVVSKAYRSAKPADQIVFMTLETFAHLIEGGAEL